MSEVVAVRGGGQGREHAAGPLRGAVRLEGRAGEAFDDGLVNCEQAGIGGGVGSFGEASWSTFYVAVDDLEETIEQAKGMGGSVLVPPMPLPTGGTIAVLRDPERHEVGLVKPPA